ncbi:MAG: DUF4124 domain-containing protein [Rhodocyclaceae bacterium]|nr:DUF4124 domain-containing protein [Rhodocyclaceae bacterium]MCB1901632.1 DUF4124 domain-containing protein [Rhodocyclaceae bacterium]
MTINRTHFKVVSSVLALSCLAASGVSSAGEIYSWKDSNGRTHYSDMPPAGAEVKSIHGATVTPPAASQPSAAPRSVAEQELDFRKRRAEQADEREKVEQEKERAETKARYCEQLSRQIKAIESGQRMRRLNAEGVPEYLNDEQRRTELDSNKADFERTCK